MKTNRSNPLPLVLVAFLLALSACLKPEEPFNTTKDGYRPIYMNEATMYDVYSTGPKEIEKPGKIYYKDKVIFINDVGKGIHVIDNNNPASPQKLSFINIPGNVDMAIKGTIMYVDNINDLVAIDISAPSDIKVVKRMKNIIHDQLQKPSRAWCCIRML